MAERYDALADGLLDPGLEALGGELRSLGPELRVPPGAALPGLVRARITTMPAPRAGGLWRVGGLGRAGARSLSQRGLLLAAVVVVLVAGTVAGAATIGLPGLRIVFGPAETPAAIASASPATSPAPPLSPGPSASSPGPSRSPTAGVLGSGLGLGEPIALEAVLSAAPFAVVVPNDARLGDPAVAWWDPHLGAGQVALLWWASPSLPAIGEERVGAILTETPGRTDEGFVQKVVGPGTTVEPVTVDGAPGFWISGAPHEFIFLDSDGEVVKDSRRVAGDTLTWWRDGILYRLEVGLGRDAAIEIAASMD